MASMEGIDPCDEYTTVLSGTSCAIVNNYLQTKSVKHTCSNDLMIKSYDSATQNVKCTINNNSAASCDNKYSFGVRTGHIFNYHLGRKVHLRLGEKIIRHSTTPTCIGSNPVIPMQNVPFSNYKNNFTENPDNKFSNQ